MIFCVESSKSLVKVNVFETKAIANQKCDDVIGGKKILGFVFSNDRKFS